MHTRTHLFIVLAILLGGGACKKYALAPQLDHPAYLRVYNDIPYILDATTKGQPLPFLTLLLDPQLDKNGVPENGAVVGDFLNTRQNFSTSYPLNAGNINEVVNYDYPGKAHVLTAPPMNGLDLSAWAQVPSGKHRILFVTRPFTDTPFVKLPAKARHHILVDTTVDLEAGEVYTMEVVPRDIDKNIIGLYLRKESFVREHFDDDKIYTSFYNLSGVRSLNISSTYCVDTLNISYSIMLFDDVGNSRAPQYLFNVLPLLPYYDTPLTGLKQRFGTSSPFVSMPTLPKEYFLDYQGLLRSYPNFTNNQNLLNMGSMPFVGITLRGADGMIVKKKDVSQIIVPDPTYTYTQFALSMYAAGNPVNVNLYDQTVGLNGGNESYSLLSSFNRISTSAGRTEVFPTINIIEMVYNKVYHMQIQKLNQSPYKTPQ